MGSDVLCLHHRHLCPPVQSAAVAERERVSRLFAEAAAVLQGFQAEVLSFIDEGEATMLGRSQGDLQRQEGQRSRLSQARRNLGQVPEADSVSFLQVRAALQAREDMEGGRWEAEGEGSGCLGFRAVPAPWWRRVTPARRSCGQQGLKGRLSGTGAPGAQAGPGGGVRPWARAPKGAQLHQVIPGRAGGTRWPGFSLHQPVGAAAGAGQRRG